MKATCRIHEERSVRDVPTERTSSERRDEERLGTPRNQ